MPAVMAPTRDLLTIGELASSINQSTEAINTTWMILIAAPSQCWLMSLKKVNGSIIE